MLGNQQKAPYHLAISSYVYINLTDQAKYGKRKNYWGQDEKVDMWTQGFLTYNNKLEVYYYTDWYFIVT